MASNGRIFVGNGGNATDPMFANVSDTNTGIAFPAADTMMLTTGGTERLRITSGGYVGVGKNNPDVTLHIGGAAVTMPEIKLHRTASYNNAWRFFQSHYGINDYGTLFIRPTLATTPNVEITNSVGSMAMRVDPDTGVISVKNGGGINFGASGNTGGMQGELLDDYEEGIWTPTLIGSGSNPSVSFGTQGGAYEKIGALVHASFFMQVSGVSSQGSGQLRIGGLPFNSSSNINAAEVPAVLLQSEPFTDGDGSNRAQFARTATAANYMLCGYRELTTGNCPIPTNAAANVGTGYFIGHITYRTLS